MRLCGAASTAMRYLSQINAIELMFYYLHFLDNQHTHTCVSARLPSYSAEARVAAKYENNNPLISFLLILIPLLCVFILLTGDLQVQICLYARGENII